LEAFENFVDQFEIVHDDVTMRLFSKTLFKDVAIWFKDLRVVSIGSWIKLSNDFSKHWGENKYFYLYLADFHALKRGKMNSCPSSTKGSTTFIMTYLWKSGLQRLLPWYTMLWISIQSLSFSC
jgi:hypothetical protein